MLPTLVLAATLAQQPIRNPLNDWQAELVDSFHGDFRRAEIWERHGHPLFGKTVASAGHLDADGTPDLLVANPGLYGDRGVVWAVSGRDGTVPHRVVAATDGDGFPDVLVGERGAKGGAGRVHVLSTKGMTFLGSIDHVEGPDDAWHLGRSVAALGDMNRDGMPESAVASTTPSPSDRATPTSYRGPSAAC